MKKFKELKSKAKENLKKHYIMFIFVCIVASFLGSEFSNFLSMSTSDIVTKGVEVATDIKESEEKNIDVSERFKLKEEQKRGVLATIVNSFTSKSIYVTTIAATKSIIGSENISIAIMIVISFIIFLLFYVFLVNPFIIVSRRIFLEGRTYKKVPMQRFLYLFRVKKVCRTALTMLIVDIYKILWSFTIVGIFIKYYSYYMVPYILAENPTISAKKAIKLSEDMMDGHKWECFKLNLSFILWDILGLVTMELSNIFFTNAYKISTYSEYYTEIRNLAIENKIDNYDLFNDQYLYKKPEQELVKEIYKDIAKEIESSENEPQIKDSKFKIFLAKNFGINLLKDEDLKIYVENQKRKLKIKIGKNELEQKTYPTRLFTIPEYQKHKDIENINYLKPYSIYSLILMFIIISFFGWIWEVSLHLIMDGELVNRGVFHGPWLPIYGGGSILILLMLYRYRDNSLKQIGLSVILCGILEYFSSWYLQMAHHGQKWWDYAGYFLNLNGRICAEGLLIFGLGGLAVVYLIAPALNALFEKFSKKTMIIVCIILVSLFSIDFVYSKNVPNVGKGISDYK